MRDDAAYVIVWLIAVAVIGTGSVLLAVALK
jgi:hypothetical protein